MRILDFLFPQFCVSCKKIGSYLCANCFSRLSFANYDICLICSKPSFNSLTHPYCQTRFSIDGGFASLSFNPTVRKLMYTFKYKPYVSDLVQILGPLMYEGFIQKEAFTTIDLTDVILTPLPLYPLRLRKRGYNQAEILAKALSKQFRLPVAVFLKRVRDTHSQVGLTRVQRRENMKGAFAVEKSKVEFVKKKTLLVVDDVLTSGATLAEAGYVLKKAGATKIYGLALAHGQ